MGSKTRWNMRFYSGAWQRGVTAGGCRNNSGEDTALHWLLADIRSLMFPLPDTFHINPQLQLHLAAQDTAVLSLSQHCVSEPQVIGFTGYPLPPESDSIGN